VLDVATTAAVLLAGALIGATGIGGVLVVPALAQFGGVPVPQAIAASALAFALPGAAALWWLWRDRSWQWRWAGLLAGAMPAAVLGALAVHRLDARWLFAAVALLALFSGARGLRSAPAAADGASPSTPALTALGAAVGAGSSLTGTGGPVLLVPALMLWRQPLPMTVALAQAVQLPLALCAAGTHAAAGALDLPLALLLGVVLLAGSLGGRAVARHLPVHALQRLVSVLLLAVGGWFGWRALHGFLS
jgi:uncharacterized membrane protein YfcA